GCKIREKKLHVLMQEEAPEVYSWWYRHQVRKDISITPLIEAQKYSFKQWLTTQIEMDNINCPHCKRSHTCHRIHPHRPQFVCTYCKKSFNPLEKTPFRRMHFIHLWLNYFDMLINGLSHKDSSKLTGISARSLVYWRKAFLRHMQVIQLSEVERWTRSQGK